MSSEGCETKGRRKDEAKRGLNALPLLTGSVRAARDGEGRTR